MELELYSYDFDPALIAQQPTAVRSASRLLLLDRGTGATAHHGFAELPALVRGDELLVVNDTRVIPARLLGRKASGGRVELLLVQPVAGGGDRCWRAMSRANKPLRPGQILHFGDVAVELAGRGGEASAPAGPGQEQGRGGEPGLVRVRFPEGLDISDFLRQHGQIPLPPYIARAPEPADVERYQTIFAAREGAVAAPTAGLHFTPELLAALAARGVELARLTLHVGPGTFRPVSTPTLDGHRMHRELYEIPAETAEAVTRARRQGRPVLAVGTTVVRALEAAALAAEEGTKQASTSTSTSTIRVGEGETDLFLRPGHRFRVVDQLITNFHWPRSTLLVLVSALAGRERVLAAYHEAVSRRYRLFSYGDAMWLR